MEEKLKEILDKYEEQITRYETQREALESRISFCKQHNFEEEVRIARVEYNAIDMLVYRWREMHKDITDVYNAWMS